MITIRDTLKKFLTETGEGNRRSMSSPFMELARIKRKWRVLGVGNVYP